MSATDRQGARGACSCGDRQVPGTCQDDESILDKCPGWMANATQSDSCQGATSSARCCSFLGLEY